MFAKAASQSWKSYCDYASWLKKQLIKFKGIHQTDLDRALWKFEKDIKTNRKKSNHEIVEKLSKKIRQK